MERDDLTGILQVLCPMHVMLDGSGYIRAVGSTLQKLRPETPMVGARFLELFEMTRPRSVTDMAGLRAASQTRLRLQFRDNPRTTLKGVVVPLPGSDGAIVNLSFGISVLDAVRDYALTSADFSATDLTIELLYLVEAKSAAMEASRQLNLRLQGAKIAAEEQAYTDTLTGLKNRRAMDHILDRLTAADPPFALMHLDLDFFKAVNDSMGHAAGDHVLQQAARIMVEETRQQDMVARVGGDEFVLVLMGLSDGRKLARIAHRLIERLEEPMPFDGQTCRISASIGTVIRSAHDRCSAGDLLHKADVALYASKRAGRGCHTFYSPDLGDMVEDATSESRADIDEGRTLYGGTAA